MTQTKTKDRILIKSLEMFNRLGVASTSTNHIAKELGISPGNLYFHYENKEEIVRELFAKMCTDTYLVWEINRSAVKPNLEALLLANFDVYWRYRFFHREMYHLRRHDQKLSLLWKKHLKKVNRIMKATYLSWVKHGWIRPASSNAELDFVLEVMMVTASSYLQFFESGDREAKRTRILRGRQHVNLFLRLISPS